MNRDQIAGAAKDIKGDIKKEIGDLTGNQALRDEGSLDKAEGKIQKGAGNLKDKL
ncbi:CsbD family protein [Skermanella mucosa]|uniref:CsbD family protein n=1 Tax=Skermanella mucosa TaxID=1789672 RepID=UPI00192B0CD9|nr:CsbD family protein [Skermanella mucosa]UEM23572.1 CsbD family protein [Skermanella mucosa]